MHQGHGKRLEQLARYGLRAAGQAQRDRQDSAEDGVELRGLRRKVLRVPGQRPASEYSQHQRRSTLQDYDQEALASRLVTQPCQCVLAHLASIYSSIGIGCTGRLMPPVQICFPIKLLARDLYGAHAVQH